MIFLLIDFSFWLKYPFNEINNNNGKQNGCSKKERIALKHGSFHFLTQPLALYHNPCHRRHQTKRNEAGITRVFTNSASFVKGSNACKRTNFIPLRHRYVANIHINIFTYCTCSPKSILCNNAACRRRENWNSKVNATPSHQKKEIEIRSDQLQLGHLCCTCVFLQLPMPSLNCQLHDTTVQHATVAHDSGHMAEGGRKVEQVIDGKMTIG